jgi:hypothetical protein
LNGQVIDGPGQERVQSGREAEVSCHIRAITGWQTLSDVRQLLATNVLVTGYNVG